MQTHIINLIKTDIHLSRLTERLKQIGIHTDVLSTNHLVIIMNLVGSEPSDDLIDIYYQFIEKGCKLSPDQDDELAMKIFQLICKTKTA